MADPKIYEFDDYRRYLRAWFKSRNGLPSQATFASRVPCAKALITDILKGKRSTTRVKIPHFARVLKLEGLATRYFEAMVIAADGETDAIRGDAERRRRAIQIVALNDPDVGLLIGIYQDWVRTAVFELGKRPDFEPDPAWVVAQLHHPVTEEEAGAALTWLEDFGLLDEDAEGNLFVAATQAWSKPNVEHNSALVRASRHQHHQFMDLSQHALRTIPGRHRMYAGLTSLVSDARYDRILQLIRQYQADLQLLIAEPEPSGDTQHRVIHIGMQAFPVTAVPDDASGPD